MCLHVVVDYASSWVVVVVLMVLMVVVVVVVVTLIIVRYLLCINYQVMSTPLWAAVVDALDLPDGIKRLLMQKKGFDRTDVCAYLLPPIHPLFLLLLLFLFLPLPPSSRLFWSLHPLPLSLLLVLMVDVVIMVVVVGYR